MSYVIVDKDNKPVSDTAIDTATAWKRFCKGDPILMRTRSLEGYRSAECSIVVDTTNIIQVGEHLENIYLHEQTVNQQKRKRIAFQFGIYTHGINISCDDTEKEIAKTLILSGRNILEHLRLRK